MNASIISIFSRHNCLLWQKIMMKPNRDQYSRTKVLQNRTQYETLYHLPAMAHNIIVVCINSQSTLLMTIDFQQCSTVTTERMRHSTFINLSRRGCLLWKKYRMGQDRDQYFKAHTNRTLYMSCHQRYDNIVVRMHHGQ